MRLAQFSDMLSLYKDKMYRYAIGIMGNKFAAEDVVQEAFIKIWKKRDQFEEVINKEAWVVTITRNLAIDKLRSRNRKRVSDIDEHHSISDTNTTPDVLLEQRDALHLVDQILDTLETDQKEIIILRAVQGYTYQEIGEILNLSLDQVKVKLFRSRKVLKEKLKKIKPLV